MIYNPATLGTASNLISFNDDSQSIYYRVTDVMVLGRQLSEYDIKLPEGMGVADFQSLMGRVNFVVMGKMYPTDETGFANGKKALRKLASLAVEQSDSSSDQGYVPFSFADDDGISKQINLKVEYVDIPEHTRNGLKLPFRLFCKVKYPVIQAQTAATTTIGSSTATTSGTSNLSFTLPRAIGLTTYSSNGSLNNTGDLPAWPTITIYGPITNPKITNSTTGEYLQLSGVTLSTGTDTAIISYDQDSTSITQGGVTMMGKLTSGSTLFTIRAGNNNLTLTGDTVGAGAYATVSCFPIWPIS